MRAATARSLRERIQGALADLKMPGALEAIDEILSRIDGGHLAGAAAIDALLQAQITLRNNRRLQAAMRSSRLPAVKTLEEFDFTFQPSIKREQVPCQVSRRGAPSEREGGGEAGAVPVLW